MFFGSPLFRLRAEVSRQASLPSTHPLAHKRRLIVRLMPMMMMLMMTLSQSAGNDALRPRMSSPKPCCRICANWIWPASEICNDGLDACC